MSPTLASPLTELRGVGPVRARLLAEAGFGSVGAFLRHLPFRYEDRRSVVRIAEIDTAGSFTLCGRITGLSRVRIRRRGLTLVRGELDDGSGRLAVLWFNRPYLASQLDDRQEYLLHGAVRRRGEAWELVNPSCERPDEALQSGAIVPIYPAIGRLGSTFIRRLMADLLERFDPELEVAEILPQRLCRRHDLPPLGHALRVLHRPGPKEVCEELNRRSSAAHRRLIYGELLALQLELGWLRRQATRRRKRHRYRLDEQVAARLEALPPFQLTAAQRRVTAEILADLASPYPMLRLLQGDVGSGKTIVAALAMAAAVESGLQAVIMAPTEILAEQHHRTLRRLLPERYRIGLLTASAADAAGDRQRLAAGALDLVVGTHALIQEGVRFRRPGLSIVDEQHRFGVVQRKLLQEKGRQSDLLVMTATPIPRSLALTFYGDLAVSVIDELPPGRSPVRTEVRPQTERRATYRWLAERLDAAERAYVVVPLIQGSDRVEAASIERHGQRLRDRLRAFNPRIVHGRTPVAEREESLRAFAAGESRVLIATTVIEVGLDVPEANLLVIESAERFGLAQLHQLRGRIGRGGGAEAICIALHGKLTEAAKRRLEVFASTLDGFRIAEADLELRGPGDLLGTQQAGLPELRVADLGADGQWVERARADAHELLDQPAEPAAKALLQRALRRARRRRTRLEEG